MSISRSKTTIIPQKQAANYLDTKLVHQSWNKRVRANTEGQYLLLGGNCAAIMSAKIALNLEKYIFF